MPICHTSLRRNYDAACRDKNPNRFFADLREAFAKKEITPHDISIRQLVEEFIPDGRELVAQWGPNRGQVSEGGMTLARLLEADAVKMAAFSNITGQIVYNSLLEGFQAEDFPFTKLIPNVPTTLDGEKIPGIGGIGDKAEVVGEGGEYPRVGLNEDWIRTPQLLKRGLIIELTREAVFYDRTGMIITQAKDVGTALGLNKEKRLIDCVVDENTTRHRYNRKDQGTIATYLDNSGTHDFDNLQASNGLVDWTDVDNAEQLLNAIVDQSTGEPVMVTGTHLICTKQLQATADRIKNATEIEVATPGFATTGNPTVTKVTNPMRTRFDISTSRQLAARMATDTSWFYGDPRKAFAYMEAWPINAQQAPPNSSDEWNRDIAYAWKANERGQAVTKEPRAMVKSTA